ncbi:MAG TPA: hypothetical protein PKE35_14785 [Anaerolineales bacterium]|nr:hypothetical protein [Anaerolineales bacterium]HMX75517.1 hypothetical protein [Anaerolineales bacterium]HMZ43811.1 hypothetical protein [Anaerolineales bacterium]HNA55614.1 hypothetical protein [Anaerolineales bacterium]HNB87906.1 hypothetical protein [Anaerolineales bacterium]
MKRRVLLTGLVSALLAACNAATPQPTATPTPITVPSVQPTAPIPPTTTPVTASLTVKDSPINCRLGPGTVYELINELDAGENALVVGRSEDFAWWYIRDPGNPDGFCWVSANVTETQGIVEELPIIQPPVTTVTDVNLRVEPNRIVINCNQFPQTVFLEAEITTNGPAFVIWRWEASTGAASNDSTLVFKESGPQIINDYYQFAEPNEYWIRLHILSPNELTEQVNIPVNCTP